MMIEVIILIILTGLLLNYLLFLLSIFKGLKQISKDRDGIIPDEFVSVIIPFRNESENILLNLNSLAAQDYPQEKFEVIYVNDSSTDNSYEKLLGASKPGNFKVVSLSGFSLDKAFKKKAVGYGIEHACGEIIVTTDADCTHARHWLTHLLSGFDIKTGFISGPVSFVQEQRLFSKLQSLEFAGLVLSGAGLIGIDRPTICNGANLAFRKSVYCELHGYQDQMHLSSGEDELLMQKIAAETDYCVKFCWDKNALVFTKPNKNTHDFFQQRRRWASKGIFYKNKSFVVRLILIYFFYLSIIVQILLSIFGSKIFLISLMLFLFSKFILEFKIISMGIDFLFKRELMKYFLISELFQIIYLIIAGVSGIVGNFKWKERKLNR
jgi:cellulose synthase/poly-beta-1,6-N-acetylglucosamine synthase-like glycosyltransferase